MDKQGNIKLSSTSSKIFSLIKNILIEKKDHPPLSLSLFDNFFSPSHPVKNKTINNYAVHELNQQQTFHSVVQVIKKNTDKISFYKHDRDIETDKNNKIAMYYFEAFIANCYKLLVPEKVTTSTNVVYQRQKACVSSDDAVGVISKKISFNPLMNAAVNPKNLDTKIYTYFSIDEVEKILAREQYDYEMQQINEYFKWLSSVASEELDIEKKLQEYFLWIKNKLNKNYQDNERHNLKWLKKYPGGPSIAWLDKHHNQPDRNWLNQLDDDIVIETKKFSDISIPFTAKHLKDYLQVKGLAEGITSSYIYEEDDLHRGNLDNQGNRVDFDKSFRPLTYYYAAGTCSLAENFFRNSERSFWDFRRKHLGKFEFTEVDIAKLPCLQHADPFYHVCKATFPDLLTNYVITSKNPYSQEEIECFKLLETHPVFVYHKFAIFLKYLLIDRDMYQHIATLHIPPEILFKDSDLTEIILKHLNERQEQALKLLLNLPDFQNFFIKNGSDVLNKIKSEFTEVNMYYENKLLKLQRHLLFRFINYIKTQQNIYAETKSDEIKERAFYALFYPNSKSFSEHEFKDTQEFMQHITAFKIHYKKLMEKIRVYSQQKIEIEKVHLRYESITRLFQDMINVPRLL